MKNFILFNLTVIIFSNSFSQSAWKPLGPGKVPFNQGGGGAIGIGRVTCLRFHPGYNGTTNKIMFLGTPDGGLWRSAGGGNDWENWHTDNLPVLGISDVAINAENPSIMYVATCDPDGLFDQYGPCGGNQATASRGIFKSADGGRTWNNIPLGNWYDKDKKLLKDFWKYPTHKLVTALKINPDHPEILTTVVVELSNNPSAFDGIVFQSKDAGQNWFMVLKVPDGFFRDLELMPGNPDVIYVGGRQIYKSSNGGKKWKIISSFADSLKEIKTIKIAVTKADPDYLYANVAPAGLIYKSADGGKTFKVVASGVNNGMYSRFVIEISPLEKELVFFNNGNYVNYFFADAPKKRFYSFTKTTHADIHDLEMAPDSNLLFVSCDGGIYKAEKTDSIKWNATDISNGLNIAKIHRIGVSQNSGKLIAGAQDVGTLLFEPKSQTTSQQTVLEGNYIYPEGAWTTISGGDGAEGIIDYTNDSIMYRSDGQGGSNMTRTANAGKNWSPNLLPRDSPGGGVVKPFFMNVINPNTLYFGFKDIVKNSDHGNGKWTKLSKFTADFPGKENDFILDFRVAPSDSNTIYCAFGNALWKGGPENEKLRLFKTTDEGKTWEDITKGLTGVDWTSINCLAVHPHHPDTVFVGFMGCWEFKIMVSYDGGNSWKNYSEGLPNEADMSSIVIDKTKNDGSMYAGTLKGVYYRNDSTGKWIPFRNGLPNSRINELEINYFNKRLYAATYGRGVWYSKLFGEE
ncbi:MAG TPA: hypothetical protein VJY62_10855 [Bacteroidia bacterium]|nr:hypothetical protein [Bacteroidia bacterium]